MADSPVRQGSANDTYIVAGYPSSNYSGRTTMLVKANGSAGSENRGLIYFSQPFPRGATITSAILHLYQAGDEAGSHTIKLQRIIAGWDQSKATWNNQPTSTTTGGEITLTKGAGPANRDWAFDVTAHMQLVADGSIWVGWKILSTTDEYLGFWSSQAPAYKPVLEVAWSTPPKAPSTLTPSAGRAASVAKPILRFDFTDLAGNTQLQAVQVQINGTNTWTSPSFDSGVVATSDAQLDLSTTLYAGLAADATAWWRVRVQDGAGLWSDWSMATSFTRKTKGTVTLINPPVSGLISEPTPPIIWSLTGRTQTAWQVFLVNAGVIVYNTGKRTNTNTSWTLPDGILRDDTTYSLHLRIWDNINTTPGRQDTPGDPGYTEVVRDFTYDYDATVDPVTALAAHDLAPRPGARLTWTRGTAPDSFLVRRNGVIIASNLTPADLSTGGTGYEWVDLTADPRKLVSWSVQAVVNGKTSAGNPTATATLQPTGVWLSTADRSISLQILDADISDWDMGEVAATYTPVGATRAVRVVQALRGHEGSVRGKLSVRGDTGDSIADQVTDLYTIKAAATLTYYLTLSNLTIPCKVGKVAPVPMDDPDADQAVSFSFWATTRPFSAAV